MILSLLACLSEKPAPVGGSDTGASGDSADSGESGTETGESGIDTNDSGDSGDSGDTAEDPLEITVFGKDQGVPNANWYGLSVAPDGSIWGATDQGLIHFDGTTERTYKAVDGLLTDTPHSVLAHSDGTIWVGHLGTDARQGEHLSVNEEGSLTLIQAIDYTESTEITTVYRLREQPYGAGKGDVWMGTNEGVCVWDADLNVFAEHAHPTHPHSASMGVGFTSEADIWNADQYQLSRWRYSNDGNLSPAVIASGGDMLEYWTEWPVEVGVDTIGSSDLDAEGETVWVSSWTLGVAKVIVGADTGTSTTTLLPAPATATSIRVGSSHKVWVGTVTGLYLIDPTTDAASQIGAGWLPNQYVQQLATRNGVMWVATPFGLVRVVGTPTE